MSVPEIAVIDANTLSCLGLQNLLEELIPQAVIRMFRSFGELTDDTPDMYVHYFVSDLIFFEHVSFFRQRLTKTIVLATGDNLPQLAGVKTLDISQDGKHLAKSILQLHSFGHRSGHPATVGASSTDVGMGSHELSVREIEVLRLLVRGYINKEIADRLHISQTTVISHRKNIIEKLGIKSVPGLTIYAVMHGYVEADQI